MFVFGCRYTDKITSFRNSEYTPKWLKHTPRYRQVCHLKMSMKGVFNNPVGALSIGLDAILQKKIAHREATSR